MKKKMLKLEDFKHLVVKNPLSIKGGDDGDNSTIIIIDESVGRG